MLKFLVDLRRIQQQDDRLSWRRQRSARWWRCWAVGRLLVLLGAEAELRPWLPDLELPLVISLETLILVVEEVALLQAGPIQQDPEVPVQVDRLLVELAVAFWLLLQQKLMPIDLESSVKASAAHHVSLSALWEQQKRSQVRLWESQVPLMALEQAASVPLGHLIHFVMAF
jgi:hypothetical protein